MIHKGILTDGCGEQSPRRLVSKVMLLQRVLKEAIFIAVSKETKV